MNHCRESLSFILNTVPSDYSLKLFHLFLEISPSACIPNPCENKADCLDDNGTSVCLCRDGFGDLYCQTGEVFNKGSSTLNYL